MNQLPSNTAFELNPLDLIPKVDRATLRNRFFPPQKAPVRRVEPQLPPMPTEGPKPLPSSVDGRIMMYLKRGLTQTEINKRTGVSRKKIRTIARRLGIATDHRPSCEAQIDEIRRLFEEGVSCQAIAFSLGFSRGAINRYVRAHGWKR